MKIPVRYLILASFFCVAQLIQLPHSINSVSAATCHGTGSAKTTFRIGGITTAEVRNTTEWNYGCTSGALTTPVSMTNHLVYWNPAIDATLMNGSSYWTNQALPNSLFGNIAASFTACDSFICGYGSYGFTLHNYVYTTTYDLGHFIRSCWIDGKTTYMPGYGYSCAA